MEEEKLSIDDAASKSLQALLDGSGQLRGRSVGLLHSRLLDVSNKLWGNGEKVSVFVDPKGGGWMIDISRGFNDVMLYAVIRSVNGKRTIVDVIDESDLKELREGTSNDPQFNVSDDPPEVIASAPTQAGVNSQMMKVVKDLREKVEDLEKENRELKDSIGSIRKIDPDEEVLIRYRKQERGKEEPVMLATDVMHRDMVATIQDLIAKGVDPEDIEIWTKKKKPQVNVILV